MSLRRMATKFALAFAAAKGVEMIRRNGGLKGLGDALSGGGQGDALSGGGQVGAPGRIGGAGGPQAGGLDGLLGMLAGALGGAGASDRVGGLLARTRAADAAPGSDDAAEEKVAGLMLRAMIQAARADGEIDDDERQILRQVADDADASDMRFIDEAMREPVDARALAEATPKGQEIRVYAAALMAIDPDNRAEAEFLHLLASGLGIGETDVDALHRSLGKEKLYS